MLKTSLTALSRGEVRVRERVPADSGLWAEVTPKLAAPVDVDLLAQNVGEGVLVRGKLRLVFELECRRCLTEVRETREPEIAFWYQPAEDLDPEDDADGVYPLPARGDELDLSEAVREQVVLHAPAFALCREECQGLCPTCGADRNVAPCQCETPADPSPWDALKKLQLD